MRRIAALAAALLLAAIPARADYFPGPLQVVPANGVLPTNVIQTCGPVTAVLNSANSAPVSLACPGASGYIITVVTTPGQPAFVGTLNSTDNVTGGNRLLFKTGVGELDVSSVILTGTQGNLEFRTVGAPSGGQAISVGSYTSGSATVTIWGAYTPTVVFPNGAMHTSEEAALRNGKAFSAGTGNQTVAVGNYESILLSNPSTSGIRAIITQRQMTCDNPTGVVPAKWYSIPNPTTNLPTTAAPMSNRKTGGANSVLTITYNASATNYPDTATATPLANRVAGMVPTGGTVGGPGQVMRTLEPGQSFAMTIQSVSNGGLTAAPICGMTMVWYEESTN